jgi:hypothetical protein
MQRRRLARLLVCCSLCAGSCHSQYLAFPTVANKALDCGVRVAAWDFAQAIQPGASAVSSDVFDALQLGGYCGAARSSRKPQRRTAGIRRANVTVAGPTFFVDAASGSDSNAGTEAAPFQTLSRGVEACRAARTRSSSPACAVVLRDTSPFVLSETLSLGPADSGLVISAFPGEIPVISGASPVPNSTQWRPWKPGNGTNVWSARITPSAVPGSLFVDGIRMIRARWPNANPETDLIPAGYSNASAWLPPRPPRAPAVPVPFAVSRAFDHFFPNWTWAVNGTGEG